MKKSFYLLMAVVLGLTFQSCATSKNASSEKIAGMWQAIVMQEPNNIDKVAYTGTIKCYNGDHSYHFFQTIGAIGFSQDGTWKKVNDDTIEESTYFKNGHLSEKPMKTEVKYHFVDDDTMIIVWVFDGTDREFFDIYKRITYKANPRAPIYTGRGYSAPMNDYIRSLITRP